MKSRWLSKNTANRQERRGSMGSNIPDDLSSKGSLCLSPTVHGIPDWENPMEAQLNSISNIAALSPTKGAKPTISIRRDTSAHEQSSKMQQNHMSVSRLSEAPNFSTMVIECDEKSFNSDGDLTFDETLAVDDKTGRINHNYKNSVEESKTRSLPYHYTSPQTKNISTRPSLSRNQITSPQKFSNTVVPISPSMSMSIEEEEMRQIEIAMERSLQDMGSVTSHQHGSIVSERSYSNHGPRYGIDRVDSSTNLTSAGCHLSMMSSYRVNAALGDPGHGFAWKREGKYWRKVPINDMDGLHAITEENENNNKSFHQLDHEKSYRDVRNSGNSSAGKPHIDPNVAAARLRELELEKEMLEQALRSSQHTDDILHHHQQQQQQQMAIRPKISSQMSCSSASLATRDLVNQRRTIQHSTSMRSNDYDTAGCHLQMFAERSRSCRHLNEDQNSSSGEFNSSSSFNSKMVWKRGPNGAWGRFPDDGNDVQDENDEDAQIAEALRRSLKQM